MSQPGAVPHSPGDPIGPTPGGARSAGPGAAFPHSGPTPAAASGAAFSPPGPTPAAAPGAAFSPPGPTPAGARWAAPGAAFPPAFAGSPPAAELPDWPFPGGPPSPASARPGPAVELPEWERLRVLRAEAEFESVRKDPRIAYALWCVVGIIGGHRFYLGDTGRSVAMLFTLGGLGVWSLLDVLAVGRRVRAVNRSRRAAIMARHGLIDAVPQH